MRLYHSTSRRFLDAIKREGLKPQAGFVCEGTSNEGNVGVYLWAHEEQAQGWAAAHTHKGEGIVLTVELGQRACNMLVEDTEFEEESEAYIFRGTIRPELIRFDLTKAAPVRKSKEAGA